MTLSNNADTEILGSLNCTSFKHGYVANKPEQLEISCSPRYTRYDGIYIVRPGP